MTINARDASRALEIAVQRRQGLSTFADCQRWHDQRAHLEREIAGEQGALSSREQALVQRVRSEWSRLLQQRLFDRILGMSYLLWLAVVSIVSGCVLRMRRRALDEVQRDVTAASALVPRDAFERDEYLRRLQHRRKELTLQKREVAASKRAIRRSSRGARAWMMGSRGGFARFARASIVLTQHNALGGLEDRYEGLEANVMLVDREAMWLKNIR